MEGLFITGAVADADADAGLLATKVFFSTVAGLFLIDVSLLSTFLLSSSQAWWSIGKQYADKLT